MDVTLFEDTARGGDMGKEMEDIADNLGTLKRRKLNGENFRPTFVQTIDVASENCVNLPVVEDEITDSCNVFELSFRSSTGVQATCCSTTGSTQKRKASDLEETDTAEIHKLDGSQSRPTSKFMVESGEVERLTANELSVKEKMPSEAELEEFFAAAQEDLNKRFKNKYNYDILNDIPLNGRFQWIQVKPGKRMMIHRRG